MSNPEALRAVQAKLAVRLRDVAKTAVDEIGGKKAWDAAGNAPPESSRERRRSGYLGGIKGTDRTE